MGVSELDTPVHPRPKLGELLVEAAATTRSHVDHALALQNGNGLRLGELLCREGHIDDRMLRRALAQQRGVGPVDLAAVSPEGGALDAIPADVALKHRALPLSFTASGLRVAMADPLDRASRDVLRVVAGARIEPWWADDRELSDALARHYGSSVARMIAGLDDPEGADAHDADGDAAAHLESLATEPTVVNLVDLILHEGVASRASDVHVEPFEHRLKVKYRIDGLLHETSPPPKHLQSAVTSRIKIMAGMNIAERFVPQDGHIAFQSSHGPVDIRVSTVPTVFGESVVMRLLDRSAALLSMEQLGLDRRRLDVIESIIQEPHGIVLVTGPTGSGKTTTLYAALNFIRGDEKKILTIEDPVEYQLEGVNQIPVNPKRGVGFAQGLRAILRQDPDVIMVGEVRDRETADIAIRSALTGHMVFSTLHTNDAPGAVTRLIDMGVEPFLLASSLRAVVAQRLVRKVCPHCIAAETPDDAAVERLRAWLPASARFRRGRGCRECRQTGYLGRLGLFEVLVVDPRVREAMSHGASSGRVAEAAGERWRPMIADGCDKAAAGLTTIGEVIRVSREA